MKTPSSRTWIVGDLGNSTLRLGEFHDASSESSPVPDPARTWSSSWDDFTFEQVTAWLENSADAATTECRRWRLGSVNQGALRALQNWIASRGESVQVVSYEDFDFPIRVREPNRVGIDRLASVFAANRLRPPHQPAIVVDAGTAITVDCVSSAGEFLGGAIAPGIQLCLQSLATGTDQLPSVQITQAPGLIGDDTTAAIKSGVFWMTACGLQGMIQSLRTELAATCPIFATGGAMKLFLPHIRAEVDYRPSLVLSGLALANR